MAAVHEQASVEVRLALRCLLDHCPDSWPLAMFWDATATDNDIGRSQGCTAGFKGIVRELRMAGRYESGARRRTLTCECR